MEQVLKLEDIPEISKEEEKQQKLIELRQQLATLMTEAKDESTSKDRLVELSKQLGVLKKEILKIVSSNFEEVKLATEEVIREQVMEATPTISEEEKQKLEETFAEITYHDTSLEELLSNELQSFFTSDTINKEKIHVFDETISEGYEYPGKMSKSEFYEITKPILICGHSDKKYAKWLNENYKTDAGLEKIGVRVKYAAEYAKRHNMIIAGVDYLVWLSKKDKRDIPSTIRNIFDPLLAPATVAWNNGSSFETIGFNPSTKKFHGASFGISINFENLQIILLPRPKNKTK